MYDRLRGLPVAGLGASPARKPDVGLTDSALSMLSNLGGEATVLPWIAVGGVTGREFETDRGGVAGVVDDTSDTPLAVGLGTEMLCA